MASDRHSHALPCGRASQAALASRPMVVTLAPHSHVEHVNDALPRSRATSPIISMRQDGRGRSVRDRDNGVTAGPPKISTSIRMRR